MPGSETLPPRKTSGRPKRPPPGQGAAAPPVWTIARGAHVEVWLADRVRPVRRLAVLRQALVDDARRHGHDLLDEIIGEALRAAERPVLKASRLRRAAVPRQP